MMSSAIFWMALASLTTLVSLVLLFRDESVRRLGRRLFRRRMSLEELSKRLEPFREAWKESVKSLEEQRANDPNNGRLGY